MQDPEKTDGSRDTPGRADLPVVLVTGSTGLIGSRVCRALRDAYLVVGLDLEPPEEGADGGPEEWVHCDLTEDASVEEALSRVRERFGDEVASVVHLAAYYDFSGEDSPLYDELTVQGTRRLIEGLRPFHAEQLVFSSSLLVMRPVEPGERLTEDGEVRAEWQYPRSKLETEALIREHAEGLPAVVLRIAGAYDDEGHSIPIAQQLRRIYEETLESRFFPGDPSHGQSFVHLDDVARCFRAVVDRRAELGDHEVFLVGEEDVVSYGEIQEIAGEALHGKRWPTLRIPAPVAKAGAWVEDKLPGRESFIQPWMVDRADDHLPVSHRRATERLGWEPRHSLRETLPEIARRLVADPAGWYEANGLEPPRAVREGGEAQEGSRG